MGEIVKLNNIENIIYGRENKPVIAAYNIFEAYGEYGYQKYGGEIYDKTNFDWTDGGRYIILTDENFEEIKAQTGKRISKIRIKYNNAYKIIGREDYCGCELIDLDTGLRGFGNEWIAVEWRWGIRFYTTINGNSIYIGTKDFQGIENLVKLSDGIYEFSYPDDKNVWFLGKERYYNNLAVAYLIEDREDI